MRIVSIAQTAVRTVFLYGREPADFAAELPAANAEDGDSDDEDDEAAEDDADAAAQQLHPTPQAQWWREAFSLGAGAAVSVALAGGSGSSGSSSTALRSAVMRPSAAVSVEILDVSSEWRLDPAAASSDDDPTDDSDGESESGRRRRLDETGSVGTVLSYAVSVTSTDVLSNTGDDGLAGLIRTLDGGSGGGGDGGAVAAASSSSSSSSSSLGFATSLAQGMNAALGLERIANPAFIAGIAMVPFEPPEGSIVEAPTPPAVLTQWQQQQQSGGGAVQFRSEVEYRATSLGTPEALSELLSRGNLATVRNHTRIHMYLLRHFMLEIEMIILARQARDKRIGTAALNKGWVGCSQALTTRATAASWEAPQLSAFAVVPPPVAPPPPEPETMGLGTVLLFVLAITGCVGLCAREIQRRRMRKSHKVRKRRRRKLPRSLSLFSWSIPSWVS